MRDLHRSLLAVIAAAGGSISMAALVARHPGTRASAKACTSRTVRRLAGYGLLTLHTARGAAISSSLYQQVKHVTLTEQGERIAHRPMTNSENVNRVDTTSTPESHAPTSRRCGDAQ